MLFHNVLDTGRLGLGNPSGNEGQAASQAFEMGGGFHGTDTVLHQAANQGVGCLALCFLYQPTRGDYTANARDLNDFQVQKQIGGIPGRTASGPRGGG
jgi:hypothetical protein